MSFRKLGMAATPGSDPQGSTDVPPPSWISLDFVGPDAANAEGCFFHGRPGLRHNFCGIHSDRRLREGDVDHSGTRWGGFDFIHRLAGVAQKRHDHIVHPSRHPFKPVGTFKVGGGARGLALQHNGSEGQRRVGRGVHHLSKNDTPALRRLANSHGRGHQTRTEQQKESMEGRFQDTSVRRFPKTTHEHPRMFASLQSTQIQIQRLPQLVQGRVFLDHHVVSVFV